MKSMPRIALFVLAQLLSAGVNAADPAGHAHNDYAHARPLLDALAQGLSSVEADIWLRDGKLLVGHEATDLDPARTLEALYLEPLRQQVAAGAISVAPLILLIDIKTDGEASYRALSATLGAYADILTRVENDEVVAGPVMAIVSGNRPLATMSAENPRYAFYDGRLADLDGDLDPSFMPLVSDNWTRHFGWRGDGEFTANERQRLEAIVAQAHAKGYWLRFWATPDAPGPTRDALWQVLWEVGVDFINTDDLEGFAAFREARRAASDP
jgi:hypothetical protein